nr:hypothetical protein [Tanacetum cinerariifolium]
GFIDKFVRDPNKTPDSSQRPPHNCLKCGNPVDGLYYRQCTLLRKKLKEVWFTICEENEILHDFLNTPKSSNDNTNIVNAPQEPFVFNQDPDENSSQSPPHINHRCCYGCGDSLDAWDRVSEIKDAFGNKQYKLEDIQELIQKLFNDGQNIHEELVEYINTPSWNRPTFYNYDDDDEDYTIAITPILSTEEPIDSLIMEGEHLDTIPTTKSDEVIKSSIEDLVPTPSESEGIPDNMCDVPFRDNSPPLDISKDQFKDFSDSNDDFTSIDDDSFSIDDIDYVEASPPRSELVSLEDVKDFHVEDEELEDVVLREKLSKINLLIAKIEALNAIQLYLPILYSKEKNSGSTTIHADISLSVFDHFHFKIEPDPGELTSIVDFRIRENVLSATNVKLSPEDDQSPLFAYVVWIFLPFLTYPVAPPYLLSSWNEDTIFDPGISIYHSFMPGVSHRSETFMKFNVYPNHLNESPMEILSSTCSPMDQ